MTARRVAALDGLRGLAIGLVLFHHFTIVLPESVAGGLWRELAQLGRYGVDLFFVLSGFLITNILLGDRNDLHYFRTFYARRALRIFPLYYTVVLFSLVVLPKLLTLLPPDLAAEVHSQTEASNWLWYTAYGTNFLIALKDHYTHGILDVGWSLCIEEHFYLIWPCVVYFFSERALKKICIFTIAAALALRIVLWMEGFSRLQIYMLTFTRIDMILFGALLAIGTRSHTPKDTPEDSRKDLRQLRMTGLILLALAALGYFRYDSAAMNTIGYSLVGLFFMRGVRFGAHGDPGHPLNRALSHPAPVFFGKYSYAMYLFHLPVAYFTKHVVFKGADFHSLPGLAIMWQFLFYAVATALCVLSALVSWYLLEKPALSLKQRFVYANDPKI